MSMEEVRWGAVFPGSEWSIVQRKKARNGLLVDERTGVYRSTGARCVAVGGGGLLLKLVKVVVLSYYPPLD
jgi:hypothetical protein